MKKAVFFAVFIMLSGSIIAQKTNLIFFTEGGEKFYVILNSVLQNRKAETNVKVTGLPAPSYKLKILFEDSTITPLEKNLMFQQGTETTFNIKKNNKDEYVVRYYSEVPIAQAPVSSSVQTVVVYSPSGPSTPVSQTTTVNSANININVNGNTASVSGTTTTSTYSATSNEVVNPDSKPENPLPGYNGPYGCTNPMLPNDFEALKNSVSSKSFDDSKLKVAEEGIASNCMLSSQVRELMLLFSFEDNKLELAKYAYGHTYDPGNYFKVNDAFTFESTIDVLNEYIKGLGK